MTLHKLTAGDGYLYLTRQVARGDVALRRGESLEAYYAAPGNPPGRWMGRGTAELGVAGEVREEQMRALFGQGMRPDAEEIMAAHRAEHVRPWMSEEELAEVEEQARRKALLGRPFPAFKPLEPFTARVERRLEAISELTGRAPTGEEIQRVQREEARRQRRPVAGFDLVFTPVKSVSLLWALHPDEQVRAAVRTAHDAARDAALRLLEKHAAFTRTGSSGQAQIETHGLIAAAFDHYDNRLGEPNLHTHVAIANKVLGVDGKWRSLDARGLYRITVAASEYYNTVLEGEISRRLGLTFTPRPDTAASREPVREITGIDPAWIEFFASRRRAIEARYTHLLDTYRATHHRDPPLPAAHELAQQATLDTRRGKPPPRSLAELRCEWQETVSTRFGPHALRSLQTLTARPAAAPEGEVPTVAAAVDVPALAASVVAAVQEQRATWTRWNILAEAERHLRGVPFTSPDHHDRTVTAVVDAALAPGLSVCIEAPAPVDDPAVLRRSDGVPVFAEHAAERFTSHTVLAAEARLVHAAQTPTTVGIDGPTAAASIAATEHRTGRPLDPGQRALVTAFACDGRLLLAGIGPAGSGKTTAMRALADVTRAAGVRLVPLATSANAAAVLATELGTPAENLHKFLWEHTHSPHAAALSTDDPVPVDKEFFRLNPGDIVLLDEAGMAGTLNLDRLVTIATRAGAVVRLLGDHRQLSAVESGGALRLIADHIGAVELTTLYRFTNPHEATATLQLRVGDTTALDHYTTAGRIRGGSHHAMHEAAYTGWRTDMLAGKTSLMAAATSVDVRALATRARADRVAAGHVEPHGVPLHNGTTAGVGDWITTRHNNRHLTCNGGRDWVKNGDAWHVTKRHPDGSLTVRHLTHGAPVRLPAAYVRAWVELLYATTTHRAQGTTVDTAHPLITPEMTRENLYVLATRARETTTFYVPTHDLASPDHDDHTDSVRYDPTAHQAREVLTQILNREAAEHSATETIRHIQNQAESLAALVPRYTHALHVATDHHYQHLVTTALPDLATDLLTDPAWPALRNALHTTDQAGLSPSRVLRLAAQRRGLHHADSVAKLLASHITTITQTAIPATPPAPPPADPDLPAWIPHPAPTLTTNPAWSDYLSAHTTLIRNRIHHLTEQAVQSRPAWTTHLGTPPDDPHDHATWLHHLSHISGYRDHHGITSDDPCHPLGPSIEPGRPAHSACTQATAALVAVRRAAGLPTSNPHDLAPLPAPTPEQLINQHTTNAADRAAARIDRLPTPTRSASTPYNPVTKRAPVPPRPPNESLRGPAARP